MTREGGLFRPQQGTCVSYTPNVIPKKPTAVEDTPLQWTARNLLVSASRVTPDLLLSSVKWAGQVPLWLDSQTKSSQLTWKLRLSAHGDSGEDFLGWGPDHLGSNSGPNAYEWCDRRCI